MHSSRAEPHKSVGEAQRPLFYFNLAGSGTGLLKQDLHGLYNHIALLKWFKESLGKQFSFNCTSHG